MQKSILALTLLLTIFAIRPLGAQVVVNEYSCSNLNQFTDNYGEHDDWIELYNTSAATVSLDGYYLSDDNDEPTKWKFPLGTSIGPNGYLLIWASGRDEVQEDNIHTNFRLTQSKNSPDHVVLAGPGGAILEDYELQRTKLGHAMGRLNDGDSNWRILLEPSPGFSNNGAPKALAYAARPAVSQVPGFYQGPVTVALSTSEPLGSIYYTTDGSEPSTNATLYTGPITFNTSKVLKATTFSSSAGIEPSFVQFNTYFVDVSHSLPVLSIASDEVENLANGNQGLRPHGSIEFFDVDGDRKTRAYGELNSHGQDSWVNDQRSLDWVTRDEMGYNNGLKKKIFRRSERDSYQRIILRAAGDDNYPDASGTSGSAHIRDAYIHDLAERGNLNIDVRRSEKAIVYLNGKYWGVYDMRELPDDHDYTDFYYGQGKFDIQYLLTWGNTWAEYGGDEALNDWDNFRDWAGAANLSLASNYQQLTEQFDVTSLADYVITNGFTVCSDWLNYNTGWWRGLNPEGEHRKWGFILWDNDATFGHYINYTGIPDTTPYAEPCDVETLTQPWPDVNGHMRLLKRLRQNPEFNQYYITRQADLMATVFGCENMLDYLDSIVNKIGPEMPQHIQRWGGSMQEWQQNVNKLRNFISIRCNELPDGLADCHGLTGPYNTVLRVEPPGSGTIQANTLHYDQFPASANFFGGVALKLTGLPNAAENYVFDRWQAQNNTFVDSLAASTFMVQSAPDTIVAVFKTISSATNTPENSALRATVFPTVFKKALTVDFELPARAVVQIEILALTGEKLRTLHHSGTPLAPGPHTMLFDDAGQALPSGMYLLRFRADSLLKTMKIVKAE
jgi:hypothetical protein